MRRRTLTLRLIAASAIWIVGTLCAAGLLLLLLFQDHIERRFDAALADHLQELAAMMRSGDVAVRDNSFLSHRHCGDGDDRVIEVCLNYGLPRSLH